MSYTKWIWHGELHDMSSVSHIEHVDVDIEDHIENMIHNLGQKSFRQTHASLYHKLQSDSKKPLYLGCTNFTRLLAVLDLVNLKAIYG